MRNEEVSAQAVHEGACEESPGEARSDAAEELARTKVLLESADALNKWTDLDELIRSFAEKTLRATGHRRVLVALLDEGARQLRVVASLGEKPVPLGVVFDWERVSLPIRQVIESRRSQVVDFGEFSAEQAPLSAEFSVRCALVVPLTYGDEVLGHISIDDPGVAGVFSDRDIAITQGIAAQGAVAIENAHLVEALRAATESTRALADLSAMMASTPNVDEVLPQALTIAREVLRAAGVTLTERQESGWFIRQAVGVQRELLGNHYLREELPSHVQAAETKSPVFVEDVEASPGASQRLARRLGYRSFAIFPMSFRGDVIGTLAFSYAERQTSFSEASMTFMSRVAFIVSSALQNSRLFEATQDELARTRLLQDVAEAAASGLEVAPLAERMLAEMREHLGMQAGDIRLLTSDGRALELLASFGWPEVTQWLLRRMPLEQGGWMATRVMRDGVPLTHEDELEPTPERLQALKDADVLESRYILMPLRSGKHSFGIMTMAFRGLRPFSEQERDLFDAIARIVSQSLDNARLYEAQHHIADRLQEALLALPDQMPGIDFAHAYHSATEAARVGGDFYDLFEVEHQRIGITVGDVAGKGIDAAVLTSLVKNAIRAHASEAGATPSHVLTLTNDVVFQSTARDSFVTVFFGLLDLRTGHLVYCSAGHTTSAIVRPDGDVVGLPSTSSILGAFRLVSFEEGEAEIALGDILFMYTDGLTEARRDRELYGEERLFALLSSLKGIGSAEAVGAVIDDVLRYTGGALSDDLALLALQRLGPEESTPNQQQLEV